MNINIWILGIVALAAVLAAVFAFLSWRKKTDDSQTAVKLDELKTIAQKSGEGVVRVEGGLTALGNIPKSVESRADMMRNDTTNAINKFREETNNSLSDMRSSMEDKFNALQKHVRETMDGALKKVDKLSSDNSQKAEKLKDSVEKKLELVREKTGKSIDEFRKESSGALEQMRKEIETNLQGIRESNDKKLTEMRETVDEKLQKTLQTRLEQSFGTVSDQLKSVHQELGKMHALSEQVDKLKRTLTSAPTRGAIGEVKLEEILREVLAEGQYKKNVEIVPDSRERVEFAIHIPESGGARRLLPVDSKFPMEDYERYLSALDNADKDGMRKYKTKLLQKIKEQAKTIREKYVHPPHSTDIAVMFLPTEGLYSVVAGEAGLLEHLHREHQVRVVGPHNFFAMLDAIRTGLHLFSLGQQSREVQVVLGKVKTEFGKFADTLEKAKSNFRSGMNKLDDVAGVRTRQMEKALNSVGTLHSVDVVSEPPAALPPPENAGD